MYINLLLWIQVNEDDYNGIINHIQEIFITIFSIWSTTKEYIEQSSQTYCSRHKYNIHKYINKNADVTTTQEYNNPYIGEI